MHTSWIFTAASSLIAVSTLMPAAAAAPVDTPMPVSAAPKPAATAPAVPVAVKKALDKAEALAVMNQQYAVAQAELRLVSTVQRRNDLIELLRLKYLKEDERNAFLFDVGTLKFFPKADIEKAQKEAADSKAEFKMPQGIRIIDVSKDDAMVFANLALAIESGRNELNQLYARRNDLVKALLEKYGFRAEDTDLDVLNGNFIGNATSAAPK